MDDPSSDGGAAPRARGMRAVDGGPAPPGLTAAHEPTPIAYEARARWGSPRSIVNKQMIEVRA